MANELDIVQNAYPVTLAYELANVATNTTVALTMVGQSNSGFVIPTGYKGHAVSLFAVSNANLTTGQTLTFSVTDDGTALANGPTVALVRDTQRGTTLERLGTQPMAAGSVVAVQVATNTTGVNTHDVDAILGLALTPA